MADKSCDCIKILFVCLGNICRSPTAEAVFKQCVIREGIDGWIFSDSAGTAAYHVGSAPDARSIAAGSNRGYDLSLLRARQVENQDLASFDYIVVMDRKNYADLINLDPSRAGKVRMMMACNRDVPDPYYGENDGFDYIIDLLEVACQELVLMLKEKHGEEFGS